jgi:hypothetical protein
MAVYKVDPFPWLRWGHLIIDGGDTIFPRTFYYSSQDPQSQHQSYCVAVVVLAPHPTQIGVWRDRVHNFLVNPPLNHIM